MENGVYQIRNLTNGKRYIGSAASDYGFEQRFSQHLRALRGNYHNNQRLQRAWNKHGADVFVFEILEECDAAKCIEREQYYLDTLLFASENDSRFNELGYNILRIAGSSLGARRSEITKQKLRESHLGKVSCFKGMKHSLESKVKMSKAQKQRFVDKNNHPMFGKTHSQDARTKISKAHKGLQAGESHPMYGKHHKIESKRKNALSHAKLSEKDVLIIRRASRFGISQKKIAARFGVSRSTIGDIQHNRCWKDF